MDMITADEGRRENGGSDNINHGWFIVRQSVFPLISGYVMHPFIHL